MLRTERVREKVYLIEEEEEERDMEGGKGVEQIENR